MLSSVTSVYCHGAKIVMNDDKNSNNSHIYFIFLFHAWNIYLYRYKPWERKRGLKMINQTKVRCKLRTKKRKRVEVDKG